MSQYTWSETALANKDEIGTGKLNHEQELLIL